MSAMIRQFISDITNRNSHNPNSRLSKTITFKSFNFVTKIMAFVLSYIGFIKPSDFVSINNVTAISTVI